MTKIKNIIILKILNLKMIKKMKIIFLWHCINNNNNQTKKEIHQNTQYYHHDSNN